MIRSVVSFVFVLSLGMAGIIPAPVASLAAPQDGSVVTISPGNPIEIAVLTFSGWPNMQDQFDAVQMALDDYGAIKGFSLQRNDFTDNCDTPSAVTAANNIVANLQNVGVIGPLCSGSSFDAAPVFNSNHVVMISHANTNPNVYTSGPKVYNRVVIADPLFDPWDLTINNLASVQTWAAAFASVYGHAPETFAKYAYDAATLLLTRIDQVSQVDGSGNLVIDRMALAAAVRNTSNFQSVTGSISLDVNGNRLHTFYKVVDNDNFAQTTLDPGWSWMGPEPTEWSLTEEPGFLQVYTQDDQVNRLLQDAPGGDFEIRTHVFFTPTQNIQFGGLYLFADGDNFMAFGRAYCNTPPPNCVGNGIYFDHIDGGVVTGSNHAMTTTLQSEAYLRVVGNGFNYTGYISENGTEWTEVGAHTASFVPLKVGLIVSNGGQPVSEIPAKFDFFVVEYSPLRVFLPILLR